VDFANECLWRGSEAIKLRPKAFAVFDYLISRPRRLVTKEELLNGVWPGTFVGEAVLKVVIRQIREALGDDPKAPRFIETSHRRGYRFIGPVYTDQKTPGDTVFSAVSRRVQPEGVVGRDEPLSGMQGWFERACAGDRQIVFVTGEAGIGKTALVDAFARNVTADREVRIGRGQCLEQYGTSEAYLPFLQAIGRLAREQTQVVDVLRAHAPMWLLQMPSLVSAADRELLHREVLGATRERMLREMGDALEALASDRPLIIILEDLHWSDYSTLDLISYLARQRQAAQLMLIGTYRTPELIVSGHPLQAVKRELLAKQQCEELPLQYLNQEAVEKYLGVRFRANRLPTQLARLIHERTEGSPLFMVNAVDYLVADGRIVESEQGWELVVAIEKIDVGVPDSIKQMIEKQFDHLDADEQRTLEAASVAGAEFSAVAVSAGLGEDPLAVEKRCDRLARQCQFIQDRVIQVQPHGETVSRYGFVHSLYQNVLYDRLSASTRLQSHRRIAETLEDLYGNRAGEIAVELAMHSERGANFENAVKYLQLAAENEIRRFAYPEAVILSRRGLELLAKLPETPERDRREFMLQITLGVPLIATEGYAAPAVGNAYLRARELCRQLGETPEISQVLWGLWTFYTLRGELWTARLIGEEFLRLSERLPYSGLPMWGHLALEITFMHLGVFPLALEHFENALLLYDPERHNDDAFLYAQHPGVAMRCFAAWTLCFLGYPDQALSRMREALALAQQLSEPHGLAHALFFSAILHRFRREVQKAREYADAAIAVSSEHGLVLYQAMATIVRGSTLTEPEHQEEAIREVRQGLARLRATGTEVLRPHFLALLADALGNAGEEELAIRTLEESLLLAHTKGEVYYEAELHRLNGELVLKQITQQAAFKPAAGGSAAFRIKPTAVETVEASFRESIEIAKRQKGLSLELRAVMSLARLYQSQGKRRKAHDLLAEVYSRFSEGFDTLDLRDAQSLLEQLS
jgi:DNA-binding winged helix-turn-helix (wHTH) protein/predicted ATPase